MRLLHRCRGRLQPVGQAVARALHEVELRHRRVAHQVAHREFERLTHHAVNHELVLGRVDLRRTVVMALVDQAVRRDDAVLVLQRRHAPVGEILPVLEHVAATAADMRLVLRRHAIVVGGNGLAHALVALWNRERLGVRERGAGGGRATRNRHALAQEVAPGIRRESLGVGFLHGSSAGSLDCRRRRFRWHDGLLVGWHARTADGAAGSFAESCCFDSRLIADSIRTIKLAAVRKSRLPRRSRRTVGPALFLSRQSAVKSLKIILLTRRAHDAANRPLRSAAQVRHRHVTEGASHGQEFRRMGGQAEVPGEPLRRLAHLHRPGDFRRREGKAVQELVDHRLPRIRNSRRLRLPAVHASYGRAAHRGARR